MTKQGKAMLLSGLVFPGMGHLSLGWRRRGFSFIIAEAALLILFIWKAVALALTLMTEIDISSGVDFNTLVNTATQSVETSATVLAGVFWLMVAIWFVALLDTYWVSKNLEN